MCKPARDTNQTNYLKMFLQNSTSDGTRLKCRTRVSGAPVNRLGKPAECVCLDNIVCSSSKETAWKLLSLAFLPQVALADTLWSRNGGIQSVTWLQMKTPWCPSTSGVSMPATCSSSSSEPARPSASGPPRTGRVASRSEASTGRASRLWPSSGRRGRTTR